MNLIATPAHAHPPALLAPPLPAMFAAKTQSAPATDALLMARMLEEVDYGIAQVTCTGVLRYANQQALQALGQAGPLRLAGGVLLATDPAEQAQLRSALNDAARGLRRMLHFGAGPHAVSVAVKPLVADPAANDASSSAGLALAPALAMLVFGKRQTCETLTLNIFASTQNLTGAETAVLRGLCGGQRPKQIAAANGVAVSTVRTQINSIRVKTHTRSIRELVDRVAALPPITPAMKSVACH